MNPYAKFVSEHARLIAEARNYPLGGFPPVARPQIAADAAKALFFSPHPDDECISGGLALRLLREAKMNVINVAVTQGSKKDRQAARYQELQNACEYLGFGLEPTGSSGLERINSKTREQEPKHWETCVKVIVKLLQSHQPRILLFPHDRDWNSTHIGTHFLVMDALKQMPGDYEAFLVETEFWGALWDPNLMVEIGIEDLTDMITATTFHVGEVSRNPYHLLLPAWLLDNVRRGTELVGGQGGAAPDFTFAALCRVRKWSQGKAEKFFNGGKQLSRSENAGELFGRK